MDEYYYFGRSHIPAFGSWDCYTNNEEDVSNFTRCFESAREAGLIRYSCEDRDLYVAGDLYDNDVVTPAVIVVPRHRLTHHHHGMLEEYDPKDKEWKMERCDYEAPPPPPPSCRPNVSQPPPKAVDEDLYKISPQLLRVRRKRTWGSFFSSCLHPACV